MYVIVTWVFFFFKQKTAYEMRISDWSSDVCSSDLAAAPGRVSCKLRRPPARGVRGQGRGAVADPKFLKFDTLALHAGQQPDPTTGSRAVPRTEERRGGKECVRTGRSRWSPDHEKKNKHTEPVRQSETKRVIQ